MLSLLAGKPNAETFPFASLSIQLKPTPEDSKQEIKDLTVDGDDLAQALQYGPTAGIPRLNRWLLELQSKTHRRAITASAQDANPWAVTVGNGSQDLLNKTIEAIINPGDSILVESPVYAGILPCMTAVGANIVDVDSDEQGISPIVLEKLLSSWHQDPSTATKPFPKLLYTTPTGANPSGTTASEQRKRDILTLVRRYNVLLMEDDAYYFLNFAGLGQDAVSRPRPKSYFALDGEEADIYGSGRVIRFDSFSKILSGGMRLGFMTAHPIFLNAVNRTTSSTNLQPSGVAQAITLSILEHWKLDGFLRHCDRVATFYKERRDTFEGFAKKVLGTNNGSQVAVAEWVTPTAGMFLWLKLRLPPTSDSPTEGDSYPLISEKAKAAGVLAVPGVAFMPTGNKTCYVRTSFSLIEEEHFEEAFKRLRGVILEAWEERGMQVPAQ